MLPEERACYIDLMVYQHQNGPIPLDLTRVKMYCSGVEEATLEATLKAKFKQTDKGWVNTRLEREILSRNEFKKEQSMSGKIGQFWKKAYKILTKTEINDLKKIITKDQVIKILNEVDITNEDTLKDTLKGSLKQRLSNNANVNANESIEKEKGGVEGKEKKKVADNVTMTTSELDALVVRFGIHATEWMISKLSNYKISKGKKYKSDYRAILSWVADEYEKKQSQNGKSPSDNEPRINRQSRATIEQNLKGWEF